MNKKINPVLAIGIILILAIIIGDYMITASQSLLVPSFITVTSTEPSGVIPPITSGSEEIKAFSSEEDFKSYLEKAESSPYGWGWGLGGARSFEEGIVSIPMGMDEGMGGGPERVSETNVQVTGIDEPDIVKTNGKEIYFSSTGGTYWRWGWGAEWIIPPYIQGKTKTIKAFPPADLGLEAEIDKIGDLLLSEDMLVIFSGDKIYGYDVSNPKSPDKEWTMELGSQSYVTGARLYNSKVYLITRNRIDVYHPCPIKPLAIEGVELEVRCLDIYHPVVPVPADVTYTAFRIDPQSGKVEKSVSFVGSSDSSVVYMSENGIYVTYSYNEDIIDFFVGFFEEECQDLIPDWLIDKIRKLSEYDISSAAKFTEFEILVNQYRTSLDDDERLRFDNETENRISDYYLKHKRELERTGIMKIDLNEFEISDSGSVPGRPLNQFSLDEYQGYLRIAVTVGEGFFGWGWGGTSYSANDVYILNSDLEMTGYVLDMGLEERIYSARFIEDKGYLVTFREIDPFYVLDLSDPSNPQLKGELKIPGYSSYLHPITKDKILGIGRDGSRVKISLFDVSSPENPSEIDKYTLAEYWSDILNTHHAFLLDEKHKIFFLPGSQGGYIFSYENDELKLVRAVSDIRARRAVYMDDYLYIIGDDEIVVLDEIDWEEVNNLDL